MLEVVVLCVDDVVLAVLEVLLVVLTVDVVVVVTQHTMGSRRTPLSVQ